MPLLPPVVLLYALASLLWFGASLAFLAQGIADGSAKDEAHLIYGYAVAAVQAVTIAGWLWALVGSTRTGSVLNNPVQIMCGVTAAAQVAILLATVVLLTGWPSEPANYFLGHAGIGALLAILVYRSRRHAAT